MTFSTSNWTIVVVQLFYCVVERWEWDVEELNSMDCQVGQEVEENEGLSGSRYICP